MYRILIADDEPIERMVARKIVDTHFGDQLVTEIAENGSDAVEIYEKEHCDIALLDIEMPGMDGLAAAKQIRQKHPEAQIIFLTAFDEFDYAKRAISVKALDYLLKPTDSKELLLTLEEAIRILDQKNQKTHEESFNEVSSNATEQESMDVDSGKLSAIRHQIAVFLEENYMQDLAVNHVAQTLNYSDAYFCKIFKQCFGVSFVMYLAELRVKKSKELLADVSINIKEISGMVGYQDPNYFTKVFKRMENVTPSEYRLRVLRQENESSGE